MKLKILSASIFRKKVYLTVAMIVLRIILRLFRINKFEFPSNSELISFLLIKSKE